MALHRLCEAVEHDPVSVHRAPEGVQLAADADEHLTQAPLVTRLGPAPLRRVGEPPAEAQAPLTDALVADHHAAGGQDQLGIAQAQAEAVIEPDRVLDHLGREAEATVGVGERRHARHAAMAPPDLPT